MQQRFGKKKSRTIAWELNVEWEQHFRTILKVPISSKFLFSNLILYFMQWASAKKISIWIKSDFLMNFFKPENPIFLRSTRAADHSIDMLRVVT